MQSDLQSLSQNARATVLFITHDIAEAVLLADSVVVMSNRPARVLANVAINIPRPRNVFEAFRNPDFDEAYDAVWSIFKSQVEMRGLQH